MKITRTLVLLNALAFVFEAVTLGPGIFTGNVSLQGLYNDGALLPAAVLQNHEYWRIVSGAFLHASIIHIGINMFSLWILGRFIEAIVGSWRTLAIYIVAMIASGFSAVYWSAPDTLIVGASGAIFGLFGALFACGFRLGPHGMSLVKANIGILVLNLVFSFAVPGISWQAHIGGLISGFIFTYLIYSPPKPVRATVIDAMTGQHLQSEVQSPSDTHSTSGH